jgi:hypothetical protein
VRAEEWADSAALEPQEQAEQALVERARAEELVVAAPADRGVENRVGQIAFWHESDLLRRAPCSGMGAPCDS